MQQHAIIEIPHPIASIFTAMVLAAKGLRNEHAAKVLLLMPPAELWRLVLEAYAQDKAAFENLPMGMHERLTTEQSQAIRTGLALGTMHPITSLSLKAA
ncbi:hypothetical protein [Ottowia sp.]|uniref:hypothetical protein n=1 Tax=Ottowia sp. TaxID=1898956 RepID=UPI003A8425F0